MINNKLRRSEDEMLYDHRSTHIILCMIGIILNVIV